ncbi:MAG: hypothetical protein LBD94_01980 [Rickettsiales bacterium]|jgi:hypothetical protein|nr:hypothetical protein [Rickettsiales bacterium]
MKLGGLLLLTAVAFGMFRAPSVAAPYRSIDEEYVPVWDEFVPAADKTNYDDLYNLDIGDTGPGEWNWWNPSDTPFKLESAAAANDFWNPEIDYDTFEFYTEHENLDNKKLILTDKRSCPFEDSIKCKEWLAKPHKVDFLPQKLGYSPTIREKTMAEIEVEKLLKDKNARKENLEKYKPSENKNIWAHDAEFQGCPFETLNECRIWKAKPAVLETASNQKPMIAPSHIDDIIALSRAGKPITSDMLGVRPLIDRYRALLATSRACCSSGLIYNLKSAGASRGLIYKFMVDDANFYQFAERCLMITDDELDESYANTKTAEVVADIRNECLCRRKEYFDTLLAPFVKIAQASPEFADNAIRWQYFDGLKRRVTVSINSDVDIVLRQLDNCPD